MTDSEPEPEVLSPAERRLHEHLQVLTGDGPEPEPSLASGIIRTARWQHALRRPLHTIGMLASGLGDALSMLLPRRQRQPAQRSP